MAQDWSMYTIAMENRLLLLKIIINPHRAQRHIRWKQTDATQSDLVPSFLSQDLSYLHLSTLPQKFFAMYLWVCLLKKILGSESRRYGLGFFFTHKVN
jgi:hypothetical protein